jgi:choline monooxygenase
LRRATRLKGIENFRAADHGLLPLEVEEWGGLVWVRQHSQGRAASSSGDAGADSIPGNGRSDNRPHVGEAAQPQQHGKHEQQPQEPLRQQQQQQQQGQAARFSTWLGPLGAAAALEAGIADPLVHVASRAYEIQCNWKVFCDNYLVRWAAGGLLCRGWGFAATCTAPS